MLKTNSLQVDGPLGPDEPQVTLSNESIGKFILQWEIYVYHMSIVYVGLINLIQHLRATLIRIT